MVLDKSLGEEVDILIRKGGRFLVRALDGTKFWRDVSDIAFLSRSQWMSYLKQEAARLVNEILSEYAVPYMVRVVATSWREDDLKIVFSVYVEFQDVQGNRPKVVVPIIYDKLRRKFIPPRVLIWNGVFYEIRDDLFKRMFVRVPKELNFNKYSPFAPQIVRLVEKLL
jgi:hypothetical protein